MLLVVVSLGFAWRRSAREGRLIVYDVTGARRWSTQVGQGEQSVTWDGTDATGRRLTPGLYWASFERGAEAHTERVVIAR